MATMVIGTDVCDLPDWVPVPTNDSSISIINLVVAGSNLPFGIFAFLSNLAIIVAALKTPSLQRPSNILLCSLATSDCLVGLVAQPLFFTWWMLMQRAQDYSCFYLEPLTLVSWLSRVLPTVLSLFHMAVISLDRCYALCRPLFYRANVTKQGAAKIAVFTTLVCITIQVLVSILPLIPSKILLAITGATTTIFPVANYIIMFIAVRYHNRKVLDLVSSQQLQGILRREKKVAINMLIVSVVLGICVIPKYVVRFFSQSFASLYPSLFVSSTTLLMLNSSINPVLYIWRDPGLRAALKATVNI